VRDNLTDIYSPIINPRRVPLRVRAYQRWRRFKGAVLRYFRSPYRVPGRQTLHDWLADELWLWVLAACTIAAAWYTVAAFGKMVN
jgi:hypothetical protein